MFEVLVQSGSDVIRNSYKTKKEADKAANYWRGLGFAVAILGYRES